jgi:2,3-dihydroxybenzoate-AMP ligase
MRAEFESRLKGVVGYPREFAQRYRALGLWRGQTLPAWFEERAALFADRLALVDGDRRVSYGELSQRVGQLAQGFASAGIRPLDRVVLQLPNGLELVETFLGLARAGAVPVLALPAHRRVELEAFCGRTRAVALVMPERHGAVDLVPTAQAVRAACPELRWIWLENGGCPLTGFANLAELRGARDELGFRQMSDDAAQEVALLQLSGGSTGVPKLIARTHDDYLYSVRASAELCGLGVDSRFLAMLPMTHNFTLSSPGWLGTFHAGGTVVSAESSLPERLFELLVRERITIAASVPSLARALVEAKPRRLPDRTLAGLTLQVGGAKLDAQLARAVLDVLGCRLQQVFGMAEGLVNYTRLDAPEAVVLGTQGRPLSAFDEVRIVEPDDPASGSLADGVVGELQTRGPYTIRGYFDDAGRHSRHFTADGFYRTGDLVRRTADGDLIVEGRIGERILRAGEKIAPEEVEAHLREHPSVRDAALIGVEDPYLGQRSQAFVTVRERATAPSSPELRRFLRQRGLAEFKLPDAVVVIADLPRTKIGKTDKQALRASAAAAGGPDADCTHRLVRSSTRR